MDATEKKKVATIAILIMILCLWGIFFAHWYPGIKESMLNDMKEWSTCGMG